MVVQAEAGGGSHGCLCLSNAASRRGGKSPEHGGKSPERHVGKTNLWFTLLDPGSHWRILTSGSHWTILTSGSHWRILTSGAHWRILTSGSHWTILISGSLLTTLRCSHLQFTGGFWHLVRTTENEHRCVYPCVCNALPEIRVLPMSRSH